MKLENSVLYKASKCQRNARRVRRSEKEKKGEVARLDLLNKKKICVREEMIM